MLSLPRRGSLGGPSARRRKLSARERRHGREPRLEGLEARRLLIATAISAGGATVPFELADQKISLSADVRTVGATIDGGVCSGGSVTFTVLNGNTVVGSLASFDIKYHVVNMGFGPDVVVDHTATYTLPGGTPEGVYTIQAVYSGADPGTYYRDFNDGSGDPSVVRYYSGSLSGSSVTSQTLTVLGTSTTTTVSSGVASPVYGQPDEFTAKVSAADGTTPTGSVQFQVDHDDFGSPVPVAGDGTASFTTSTLEAGTPHTILAEFHTNTVFGPSSGSTTTTVSALPTTTVVTSSDSASDYGQAVTLSAAVADVSPGGPTPTGGVQFQVDGGAFGPFAVLDANGRASLVTTALRAGTHQISAVYIPIPTNFLTSDASASPVAVTVSPAPLTITPAATRVYGDAITPLTASYIGFVNGDTAASLGTPPTFSTSATASSDVGSYPLAASGAVDPDYTISYAPGALAITPAPLTIAANDSSKPYGAALPAFSASYIGFVNGDTAASLGTPPTFSTAATASSHVGSYPITASGAADPDYTIAYAPAVLAVTAAPLTIRASDTSTTYGTPVPPLSAAYIGFVDGDTPASLTALTMLSTTATASSHVGDYAIAGSGAAEPDYAITFVAGRLSVRPASLTITANDQSSVSGSSLPALTATFRGFEEGDSPASLATPPTLATTATSASPAGSYPITASGASSPDYTITFVPGTLAIAAPPASPSGDATGSGPARGGEAVPPASSPGVIVKGISVMKRRGSIQEVVVQLGGVPDAGVASDASAYRLAVGVRKNHATVYRHPRAFASASYDSTTDRVTLTLRKGLASTPKLQLTINSGVLGPAADGRPSGTLAFSFGSKRPLK